MQQDSSSNNINNGVMLNAYPDSIGNNLKDVITMLHMPEFKDVFSLFYILPTFFNSDLDRGFSIIDYNINDALVSSEDIKALHALNIMLKFDIVLNHLSVASPQFKDLMKNGDASPFKDFFIDWNEFWKDHGTMNEEGIVIPNKVYLDKLFMRKSGLPILKVVFPDGSERPYWNTFYQKITYQKISPEDLNTIAGLSNTEAELICNTTNTAIDENKAIDKLAFTNDSSVNAEVLKIVNNRKTYLGQMDVNASSPLVWDFYDDVLQKVAGYGCKILRLDAFAYLHKEVGETNFFNKPGTWEYLSRVNAIAKKYQLTLLPEIHAEFRQHLHNEVAKEGYMFYDFFMPGLIIHAIEKGTNTALLKWAGDIIKNGFKTVNMLGCHDGIPVLDLKGLLPDEDIDEMINLIIERGGRVKNLYGADGKKISYYQVNATYFSALGEDEQKMLLARAIQMFMPGLPQIWYLDVFAGKNDYDAVDKAGADGHKEINRTNLTLEDVKSGLYKNVVLKQLEMMKLRNTCNAFKGQMKFHESSDDQLHITWKNGEECAEFSGNLKTHEFIIRYSVSSTEHLLLTS